MPHKQTAQAADDSVLRLAQTSAFLAFKLTFEQPARARQLCTRAIDAIHNGRLHKSADAAVCKEARSTLSFAFRVRACLHTETVLAEHSMVLSDCRAALDTAACSDDAVLAHIAHVHALLHVELFDELPAACNEFEKALRLPREPAPLRFVRMGQLRNVGEDHELLVHARRAVFVHTTDQITDRIKEGDGLAHGGRPADHENAVACYSAALEIIRTKHLETSCSRLKARALRARARSYFELRMLIDALANAKLAVRLDPSAEEGHLLLSQLLLCARECRASGLALLRGAMALMLRSPCFSKFISEDLGKGLPGALPWDPEVCSEEEMARACVYHACAVCNRFSSVSLLRCKRCRLACYCSREHQREDWGRHRRVCATFAEIQADNAQPTAEVTCTMAAALKSVPPRKVAALRDIPTFAAFAKYFPFERMQPQQLSRHALDPCSSALTLAAVLVAFELDGRRPLCVHLVNVDHQSRSRFECSAQVMSRLPFPDMELLFCGLSALDGREGADPDEEDAVGKTMSGGNKVTARMVWSLWHEAEQDLPPPDLVLGFNTDLTGAVYEWPATLRALVARKVPCVFTAASEGEYERALAAVRAARGSLCFHGRAPFPSPRPSSRFGELQYSNSSWVAFCGGEA